MTIALIKLTALAVAMYYVVGWIVELAYRSNDMEPPAYRELNSDGEQHHFNGHGWHCVRRFKFVAGSTVVVIWETSEERAAGLFAKSKFAVGAWSMTELTADERCDGR